MKKTESVWLEVGEKRVLVDVGSKQHEFWLAKVVGAGAGDDVVGAVEPVVEPEEVAEVVEKPRRGRKPKVAAE
ncbi:hypothetical protein [Stutzerimonas kunmingensis]|uniref:Uncharacterized protein n=1 Tax=Stutzerimonas kunmingensis TaxID=1211807 RepID=A0A9X1STZ6_9GAMM|nr:hypothetical protein [Stutzerimonas kunmingensis]MCD1608621.1 hypothetical protein [Stutzerimonas kunmingensis]